MILKCFSIYDSAAEVYSPPFFLKSKGEALRAFSDSINDEKTTLSKHPEHFFLFYIGEYDDQKAEFSRQEPTIVSMASALDFKAKE